MTRFTKWCDDTLYPEFTDYWDEKMLRDRVLSVIESDFHVLDLGAGRGHKEILNFKGHCRSIAGVDPDDEVLSNPFLDDVRVQNSPHYLIPSEDSCFDLVFCNSVIEHISNKESFFQEIIRVLKPSGKFIAKTPNRLHYVPLCASLTPHWFHEYYNRLRGRDSVDTFPTTYACNTRRSIMRTFGEARLDVDKIDIVEGRPEYLRLTLPTYLCGAAYERLMNSTSLLETFRCVIFIHATKPPLPQSPA